MSSYYGPEFERVINVHQISRAPIDESIASNRELVVKYLKELLQGQVLIDSNRILKFNDRLYLTDNCLYEHYILWSHQNLHVPVTKEEYTRVMSEKFHPGTVKDRLSKKIVKIWKIPKIFYSTIRLQMKVNHSVQTDPNEIQNTIADYYKSIESSNGVLTSDFCYVPDKITLILNSIHDLIILESKDDTTEELFIDYQTQKSGEVNIDESKRNINNEHVDIEEEKDEDENCKSENSDLEISEPSGWMSPNYCLSRMTRLKWTSPCQLRSSIRHKYEDVVQENLLLKEKLESMEGRISKIEQIFVNLSMLL